MEHRRSGWRLEHSTLGWRGSILPRETRIHEISGPQSFYTTSRQYKEKQKEKRKEKPGRFEGENREGEDIFQGVEDRRGRDYDSTGPHDKRYYVDGSGYGSLQENLLLKLLQQDGQYPRMGEEYSPGNTRLETWQDKIGDSSSSGLGTQSANSSPRTSQPSTRTSNPSPMTSSSSPGTSQSSPTGSKSSATGAKKSTPTGEIRTKKKKYKAPCATCAHCGSQQISKPTSQATKERKSIGESNQSSPNPLTEVKSKEASLLQKHSSMLDINIKGTPSPSRERRNSHSAGASKTPGVKRPPVIPDPDYDIEVGSKGSLMKYVPAPVPPKNSPQESRNSSLREGRGGRDYTKPKDSGRLEELRSSERRSSEKEVLRRGSGEDRRRGSERDERVEGRGSVNKDRRGSEKNEEQERRGSGINENEGSGRRSVWVNSNRYMGSEEDDLIPTKTLKEALKNRPSVSEFVKEITRASELDRQRERERKLMERELEESKGEDDDEDEAKKIYREILEIVSMNSPASLTTVKGRMVGYEEREKNKNKKKEIVRGKQNSSQQLLAKIRINEDRESITTSLDSYPFAPTSPWHHGVPSRYNRFGYPVFPEKQFGLPPPTGPCSFSGFSPNQGISGEMRGSGSHAGPVSLIHTSSQPKKKKKKGLLKYFF